jgi:hypothetical protein
MKKILFIIPLLFCANIYAHKDKSYQCIWHENNVDIFKTRSADFKYSEEGMFYYLISNDSDNIFIDIRIFGDEIAKQVLRSGMTIWIDPGGKKVKKAGVRYPVRHENHAKGRMADSSDRQVPDNMKNRYPVNLRGTWSGDGAIPDFLKNSLMLIGFSESGPMMVTDLKE